MRVESGGYGKRKRRVRKSEELKQRSYRGTGRNGWISRERESNAIKKGRVVPRKKRADEGRAERAGKRIRKRKGEKKIEKRKETREITKTGEASVGTAERKEKESRVLRRR